MTAVVCHDSCPKRAVTDYQSHFSDSIIAYLGIANAAVNCVPEQRVGTSISKLYYAFG